MENILLSDSKYFDLVCLQLVHFRNLRSGQETGIIDDVINSQTGLYTRLRRAGDL